MFYIAVTIWAIICFVGWIYGMRWIDKQDKKRKR